VLLKNPVRNLVLTPNLASLLTITALLKRFLGKADPVPVILAAKSIILRFFSRTKFDELVKSPI